MSLQPFMKERPAIIEGRIITVLLGNGSPHVKKLFRCCSCGLVVFEYFTDIRMIFDGEVEVKDIPTSSKPIDRMCHRCKVVYRIV